MRRVAAALVEDRNEFVEIDEVASTSSLTIGEKITVEETDAFSEPIKPILSSQSKRVKNKFYKMRKRQPAGTDGTQSKFIDPEQISGYGMFDVVEPPYNLDILASLFEENAIHNACIWARTMNTVGLGYVWEDTAKSKKSQERAARKDGEDSSQKLRDRLQKKEEELNNIFDNFNIEDSFVETMIKIWIDVLSTGNGYMEIGRNINGNIGYIGHIPSIHIRVRRAKDGYVQNRGNKFIFFRNFQDTETKDTINSDPRPNEIIHFKMYSPTNTYYGVPSAVSALTAIIGDKFAKEYNIDYFENKSIPRYAIILKGAKLSEKSKMEVVNYFRNEVKGNNHGTLFIPLPSTLGKDVDIKFEKLENTVQEGSFDKYRKSNRDEIMVAHRVPAPKIGVYDNANLAVSRDADKTFKVQVTGPDQRVVEKKIGKIVKEFTDLKEFKFAEIDVIDDDIRSRIWDRYLRTSVIAPNEVRSKIGLTPIEGGDVVLPFPTQLTKEMQEFNMEQVEKEGTQSTPPEFNAGKKGAIDNGGGAPVGNTNAHAGSPPKGSQDAKNKESSSADQTAGRKERGQAQDGQ
jgi:PBSX family phage portal protein